MYSLTYKVVNGSLLVEVLDEHGKVIRRGSIAVTSNLQYQFIQQALALPQRWNEMVETLATDYGIERV